MSVLERNQYIYIVCYLERLQDNGRDGRWETRDHDLATPKESLQEGVVRPELEMQLLEVLRLRYIYSLRKAPESQALFEYATSFSSSYSMGKISHHF